MRVSFTKKIKIGLKKQKVFSIPKKLLKRSKKKEVESGRKPRGLSVQADAMGARPLQQMRLEVAGACFARPCDVQALFGQ